MDKRYTELSKTVSYALRHNPAAFGLNLDAEGWVAVGDLLNAINNRTENKATIADICYIIDNSEKRRFEIRDNKIRATYGHSIEQKIEYNPQEPPEILYHGTSREAGKVIVQEGLKPMSRQYVHLSSDYETAVRVGKRHDSKPVVFSVHAALMHKQGYKFYHTANDTTWLCEEVPLMFLAPCV